jgi:hypothetical protein
MKQLALGGVWNRRRATVKSFGMTNREKLHHLVAELSEPDVDEALQYITWQQENGFAHMLHALPSERTSTDEKSREQSAQPEAGTARVIFLDDVKRSPDYGSGFVS